MTLDVPTLFVVVTTVTLLMAFWISMMAWGQPRGDALWALALSLIAYASSNVLFALRQLLPEHLMVLAGNMAYVGSLSLMLVALRRFRNAPVGRWRASLPVLLVPVLISPLIPDPRISSVSVNLLCVLQCGMMLSALYDRRYPMQGRGRIILFAAYSGMAGVLLLRAGAVYTGMIGVGTSAGGERWLALVFLLAMCAVLSIALGFVYMTMERAERLNYEMAMKDMLTGLSNRRAISEELAHAVARAQRQGALLSLLLIDIDHFKRVNDEYGHPAGDAVLQSVAHTLAERLRAQDQIGRFGGEEFIVVLPDTGLDGARILAEALREAIEATPATWGAHGIAVTISVGVRGGLIVGGDTRESLVAAADAALYRAKQGGRNRVEMAGAPVEPDAAAEPVTKAARA
ncbi:GGDEF domain-containing protein [Pelomonas sp. KK5]|uniref:GGDEF domain-containing protein n=1 Tax=Pelomonas sp. KK5 TaxID=1855730 RepID=UPI00097C9371|nr:GGDEF domain-containing protein [Pelomonas sp. KK5]